MNIPGTIVLLLALAASSSDGGALTNAAAAGAPTGTLELTVSGAILLGLENNAELKVERLLPAIRRTVEAQERAVFDPVLRASLARTDQKTEDPVAAAVQTNFAGKTDSGELTLETLLPSGTRVALGGSAGRMSGSALEEDLDSTRVGLSVTQSLLRGGRMAANLASLRQARLETQASEYELRGFAESLVARIERSCWDCQLNGQEIEIFEDSLKLAEEQLAQVRERIAVGGLAAIEAAAAEAEVAARKEGLINARSALERTQLELVRLVTPSGVPFGGRQIRLLDPLPPPDAEMLNVEERVQVAARMRPDLNQARLAIQRGDLEVVKTRNGLLPKLDLFVSLGRTGYAASFGDAAGDLGSDGRDTTFGIVLEHTLGRREAEGRHRQAMLGREQSQLALQNLAQLAEFDVRSACVEVQRAVAQVSASAATRKFREAALKAETEKLDVGSSTTLLVAQAQRDLLQSRLQEARAAAGYRVALVELYRLEGSLLERRGVAVASPP
jgi:outer membrane protein